MRNDERECTFPVKNNKLPFPRTAVAEAKKKKKRGGKITFLAEYKNHKSLPKSIS